MSAEAQLTAVILAHADPAQCRRLITALSPVPVVLHVDGKTSSDVAQQMAMRLPTRVEVCERRRTDLASWSLVDAELRALRVAFEQTAAAHIAVLSGADYPLMSMAAMAAELEREPGTRLWNVPLPYEQWSTRRNPDGGFWRFRRRFVTYRGRVLFLRDVPLRWLGERATPDGVVLRAGSQWKVYHRREVRTLLHVVEQRPDLVRFWRTTLVPEETFAPSVLGSNLLSGQAPLPPRRSNPWLTLWPDGGGPHPQWLTMADLPVIERKVATRGGRGEPLLFARKFRSGDSDTLRAVIDARLRRAALPGNDEAPHP